MEGTHIYNRTGRYTYTTELIFILILGELSDISENDKYLYLIIRVRLRPTPVKMEGSNMSSFMSMSISSPKNTSTLNIWHPDKDFLAT